ncbi:MAG TPA: DUF3524 domain-containing protein [Anaerolineae bacterium]
MTVFTEASPAAAAARSAPRTVWLLNPYHAGSHAAWAEGYAAHSRHGVTLLKMDGHFWKWRLQGGGLELAGQARARLAAGERPDLLLASSMVNLPAFLALLRRDMPGLAEVPVVLYMHENQLTYPPPPGSKRDLTYALIQHLSMLAADRVCFNSAYHLAAWFDELPRLLKHFPDYTHLETVAVTRAKSQVLPVGVDLRRLDRYQPRAGGQTLAVGEARMIGEPAAGPAAAGRSAAAAGATKTAPEERPTPLLLWNQRWEYDKDPATMLQAAYTLAEEGLPFRLALAGENFRVQPAEFAEARDRLAGRLVHFGYAENEVDYAALLWSADVVLSTAIHEFFGVSILEAIYCGCRPVLPRRLSYPELIPTEYQATCLYDDFPGLLTCLRAALAAPPASLPGLPAAAAAFDWDVQAPAYDDLIARIL